MRKKMNTSNRLSLITISLLITISSFAQKQWTLEECIKHAVENNITIKQMEIQIESAEIDLNTSQMSRLPDLNAGSNANWGFGLREGKSGLYENTTQFNAGLSVSTSMPIFTGFRIPNQISRNKIMLEAATLNLERAKEDISLTIASYYLQVLFAKELVHVCKEQLDLYVEQLAMTKLLFANDKVPESQIYDVEAQIAKDEVALIEAENNLKLSLLDLAQMLELEREVEFDIYVPQYDDVILAFTSCLQPLDIIYENAIRVKPVVREQELQVQG
ncbi:TolC family protein, partial [Bacteroidales bacterium OttesenSCG-928-I14]|nr:TolC family protein [Bacteroidales bacterium OttesenSCG-928-I14]